MQQQLQQQQPQVGQQQSQLQFHSPPSSASGEQAPPPLPIPIRSEQSEQIPVNQPELPVTLPPQQPSKPSQERQRSSAEVLTSPSTQLKPCAHCGRSFRPGAIEKHEKVCQSVFPQKEKERYVFDSKRHRAKGTALETFIPAVHDSGGLNPTNSIDHGKSPLRSSHGNGSPQNVRSPKPSMRRSASESFFPSSTAWRWQSADPSPASRSPEENNAKEELKALWEERRGRLERLRFGMKMGQQNFGLADIPQLRFSGENQTRVKATRQASAGAARSVSRGAADRGLSRSQPSLFETDKRGRRSLEADFGRPRHEDQRGGSLSPVRCMLADDELRSCFARCMERLDNVLGPDVGPVLDVLRVDDFTHFSDGHANDATLPPTSPHGHGYTWDEQDSSEWLVNGLDNFSRSPQQQRVVIPKLDLRKVHLQRSCRG